MLDKESKGQLYTEYLASRAKPIKMDLPNGLKVSFSKCWNYKDVLREITFNTLSKPDIVGFGNIMVEEVNLMPVANLTYYHITIKR